MKGFTLIEVLAVALILGLISAGIFAVLNMSNIIFKDDNALIELQQQVRLGIDAMVKEARQSNYSQIALSDADTKITFNIVPQVYADPWTGPISYYRDINDANNDGITDQVIREYPLGTFKVLANDITVLNFSLTGNILEIGLAAKKSARGRDLCFPAPCEVTQKALKEIIRLRD